MAERQRIGVLALQGSFQEHCTMISKLGATPVEVRKVEHLAGVSGLIIPGGESTTMANVADRWGLIPSLREFAASGRPIWGTCAGLIFLADAAEGQKEGGQALIGGLDVLVSRNFFGSQIDSFEIPLAAHPDLGRDGCGDYENPDHFRAIFIRAPAVLKVGEGVEILAELPLPEKFRAAHPDHQGKVIVAVRQGSLMGTAFHPEITSDVRWHRLFCNMCAKGPGAVAKGTAAPSTAHAEVPYTKPPPLPVR